MQASLLTIAHGSKVTLINFHWKEREGLGLRLAELLGWLCGCLVGACRDRYYITSSYLQQLICIDYVVLHYEVFPRDTTLHDLPLFFHTLFPMLCRALPATK